MAYPEQLDDYNESRSHQVKRLIGRSTIQAVRLLAPSKPPLEATELDCISDAVGFVARQTFTQVIEVARLSYPKLSE